MKQIPPIILASNSPRRRDLLRQIGLDFSTDPADVDERVLPGEKPDVYAIRVALDKARVAARRTGNAIIIAADTVVVMDDSILGKPNGPEDAKRMLTLLSGKMHRVLTGLVIMETASRKTISKTSVTKVWFRNLSGHEIEAYVASGEPLDKAGAYGIQEKGAILVSQVEGCFYNVVGLPIALLGELLHEFGVDIL